jgi:hypothetical protein
MAEPTGGTNLRPAAVEIISAEEVAEITSRYDALINSLETELTVALQEAEAAESHLRMHPAARVFDDDFEAFVMWATQSQTVEIRQGDDGPGENTPIDVASRIEPAIRHPEPMPPTISSSPRVSSPPPITSTPIVRATPVVAPPAVTPTIVPPPADNPSARSGRLTGRTTVVTRPGSAPPPPAAPAAQPEDAAPPAEKFWDDGRTNRSTRADGPTRAERDRNRNRISTLPSTLLLQAGAVIVIVAILVLKLG